MSIFSTNRNDDVNALPAPHPFAASSNPGAETKDSSHDLARPRSGRRDVPPILQSTYPSYTSLNRPRCVPGSYDSLEFKFDISRPNATRKGDGVKTDP